MLEFEMDEDERLAIIGKGEGKKKKEKKTKKRKSKEIEKDETKSDGRKMAKLQKEIDEMRQTIKKLAKNENTESKPKNMMKYAIGYSPDEYLSLGFIASANWISEKIAVNMRERMRTMDGRWDMFKKIKNADVRSIVTCVTYNRDESCRLGMWHTTLKKINHEPEQSTSRRYPNVTREELRIHACTLCLKALGVLCMHSVMDCPWTLEENWQ